MSGGPGVLNFLRVGFGSFSRSTPPGVSAQAACHPERRRKITPRGPDRLQDDQGCLQDGPDGLQVRPRSSEMASKTAREGPRCLQARPTSPQESPRRPKRRPRGLQDGPRSFQEVIHQTGQERPMTAK
eukprot:91220-Pyramimonas_sp.AAC.1